VYERFRQLENGNVCLSALESVHDDVFFDLQYEAIAKDASDRFCDLEDRIVTLISDLRLLRMRAPTSAGATA
jgi:hypothetical protein